MYTNDLNSAYEYERERRNDERRVAADSQRVRGLGRKHKFGRPSPMLIIGILTILVAIMKAL